MFAILFVAVYFLVVFYKKKSKRMNCGKPILNVFKTYFELIGKTGSEAGPVIPKAFGRTTKT